MSGSKVREEVVLPWPGLMAVYRHSHGRPAVPFNSSGLAFSLNSRDIINSATSALSLLHSLPLEKGLLASPVISPRRLLWRRWKRRWGVRPLFLAWAPGAAHRPNQPTPLGIRDGERKAQRREGPCPRSPAGWRPSDWGLLSASFLDLQAQALGSRRPGCVSQLRHMKQSDLSGPPFLR